MERRDFTIAASSIAVASFSGCSNLMSSVGGTPEPGEELKEIQPTNSYFASITLFDNGVAEIELQEDHEPWARIGFTHAIKSLQWEPDGQPDDAYAIWDAPEFAGPITVDVETPIKDNGPYPNPRFKMKLLPEGEENVINTGTTSIAVEFEAPNSYLPEE